MKTHKDLDVWKKSIDFVIKVYNLIDKFPNNEKYGIVSQIRKAAVSIPSNIAEGSARNSKKELIQFLFISLGSAAELETQLIISEKLKYIENLDVLNDLNDIQKMIMGLIKYLRNKEYNK